MARLLGRLYDSVISVAKAFDAGSLNYSEKRRSSKTGKNPGSILSGSPASWRTWSGDPYQQTTEFRNWVYTAVDYRATRRQTPPLVAITHPNGTQDEYKRLRLKAFRSGSKVPHCRWIQKNDQTAAMRTDDDLEYLDVNSPAMRLLHNPNDPQIGIDLWYMDSLFQDLTGRSHIWKVRNGSGQVIELWIIPTQWVEPMGGSNRLIDYYYVRLPGAPAEKIDADDIITTGKPTPFGYLSWQGPTQAHGLNIDLFNAMVISRFNGLVNGANVGSLITVPSSMAADKDKMDRFENSLLSRLIGTINYNRPLIAEEGANLINLAPQLEIAFQASTEKARQDIFAAYDLDESVMGYANESTYAASVVTKKAVYEKVTKPFWERRNMTITEQLLKPDFGENLIAVNEYKTEETPEEKEKRIKLMADKGAITINEIRQEYSMEPFEDPLYDEPIPVKNDFALGNVPPEEPKTPPGGKQAMKHYDRFALQHANGVHE